MSFHTVTMMIRWILTAQGNEENVIRKIRQIPYNERINNKLVLDTITYIKNKWSNGTQIEKLAILGWDDKDSCKLLCDILENYDSLRSQFNQHTSIYGAPSELTNDNITLYENAVINEMKNIREEGEN